MPSSRQTNLISNQNSDLILKYYSFKSRCLLYIKSVQNIFAAKQLNVSVTCFFKGWIYYFITRNNVTSFGHLKTGSNLTICTMYTGMLLLLSKSWFLISHSKKNTLENETEYVPLSKTTTLCCTRRVMCFIGGF